MNTSDRQLRKQNVDAQKFVEIALTLLTVMTFWRFQALYGFSLTDDGAILAMSDRIMNGQSPHSDFFTIRPAGSAYLHSLVTVLDIGVLAYDRLFVVIELYFISYVTIKILIRKKHIPGILTWLLTTMAFLVNVNTWPIMAWHTIDGLFFFSIALRLAIVECSRKYLQTASSIFLWIMVGFSALSKQGFLLSFLVITFYLVAIRESDKVKYAIFSLVPIVVYFSLSQDAEPSAYTQLSFGSSKVSDALLPLWVAFNNFLDLKMFSLLLFTSALSLITSINIKGKNHFSILSQHYGVFVIYAIPIAIGIAQEFSMSGSWIYFVVVSASINLAILAEDRHEYSGLVAMLFVALVISISRGVPIPSLLAGSFLVSGIYQHMSYGMRDNSTRINLKQKIVSLSLIVTLLTSTVISRNNHIYQEGARSNIRFELDEPSLRYIRMSDRTALYISLIKECIREYPAKDVAILPDGAAIYPLLNLSNPFHLDWFYNMEIDPNDKKSGLYVHRSKMLGVVEELNSKDGWLILFQSRKFTDYTVENVGQHGMEFSYIESDLDILKNLVGQRVTCGSLSGIYSP